MKALFAPLAAAGVLTLCASPAAAQSFRCKSDLVNVGDSRASVLVKCGEPAVRDSFCMPVKRQTAPTGPTGSTNLNTLPCVDVDEWTYNPGYGQFMTTLRFQGGQLSAITYGDRVK